MTSLKSTFVIFTEVYRNCELQLNIFEKISISINLILKYIKKAKDLFFTKSFELIFIQSENGFLIDNFKRFERQLKSEN